MDLLLLPRKIELKIREARAVESRTEDSNLRGLERNGAENTADRRLFEGELTESSESLILMLLRLPRTDANMIPGAASSSSSP